MLFFSALCLPCMRCTMEWFEYLRIPPVRLAYEYTNTNTNAKMVGDRVRLLKFYLHDFDCIIYGLLRRQPKSNRKERRNICAALCTIECTFFLLYKMHSFVWLNVSCVSPLLFALNIHTVPANEYGVECVKHNKYFIVINISPFFLFGLIESEWLLVSAFGSTALHCCIPEVRTVLCAADSIRVNHYHNCLVSLFFFTWWLVVWYREKKGKKISFLFGVLFESLENVCPNRCHADSCGQHCSVSSHPNRSTLHVN